jgi:SAM-dependent methyltransferase
MTEAVVAALPLLVCPHCRDGLTVVAGGARCRTCARDYPERDGILRLTTGSHGPPGYDPHHFQLLASVEERHFWFVARRELILDVLRRTVPDLERRPLFDIGCGSGGLLAFLAAAGVPLAGACDAYLESLNIVRGKVTAPLFLVDEGRLPPLGPGQGMVGLFDVLEHLDDDLGTLRWIQSVLDPGGVLVLTVPAHPFLFGAMDRLAHHRRRYRRQDLAGKLVTAGFQIRVLTHFMAPLFPLLVVRRWLGEKLRSRGKTERLGTEFAVVPGLNGLLRVILRLERFMIRALSMPFGSSILAVVTRPPLSPQP